MSTQKLKSRNTLTTYILIKLMLRKVAISNRAASNTVHTAPKNTGEIKLQWERY